jgi:hypothetical protein
MQTSKLSWLTWMTLPVSLAACSTDEHARRPSPRDVATNLACAELANGGAARPFADDAAGVAMRELRADDLATYDRETSELAPDAPVGIRYSLAAEFGSSSTWLERQIACYRAALAGANIGDPLLVAEARVVVRKASGRYLVDVTSDDRQTAREVLRAARR